MNETLKALGAAAVMVGAAWIVQTSGLRDSGLLSMSPGFLFLGAVILGCGAGALLGLKVFSLEGLPTGRIA